MTNESIEASNQGQKLDKESKINITKTIHKTHHKSNSGSSGSSKGASLKSQSKQNSMASGHSVSDQNMKLSDPLPSASHNSPALVTEKMIGEGLQAKVYKAVSPDKPSDTQCVKVFFPFKNLDQLYSAETEFKIARLLEGHPNTIKIYTFEMDKQIQVEGNNEIRNFMNMEYCEHGDLYDFMSKYTHYAKQQKWPNKGLINHDVDLMKSMMIQIVDAVSALHNKTNCAHLDLKLENILITKDGILKLCDFGFCLYS